jgi:hypothetical protein
MPDDRSGLFLALLFAACARPTVSSCADDLSGIWRTDDDRRFHLVDRGDVVEVYPLFDPIGPDKRSPPWRTPGKTELERTGAALVGRTTLQAQEDARRCTIVTPARLEACADDRANLSLDLRPTPDLTTCRARPGQVQPLAIERI